MQRCSHSGGIKSSTGGGALDPAGMIRFRAFGRRAAAHIWMTALGKINGMVAASWVSAVVGFSCAHLGTDQDRD